MRRFIVGLILGCSLLNASAENDSIAGAHSVVFQPVQADGNLIGCSLVYRAVQFDQTYQGEPVLLLGNIGIHQVGAKIGVSFKIGVKPLKGTSPFVSPNFAYLQTENATTAKVKQSGQEVEKGFRYVVYSFFDPSVQQVIDDILVKQEVILAFNRKPNGLDVLVPLDLQVIDTSYPGGNHVSRVKSEETIKNFTKCYVKLLGQVESELKK